MALLDEMPDQHRAHDFLKRALSDNRLPSAMAFIGPDGAGKKRAAWAIAQAMLCSESEVGACGVCASCTKSANERHEAVHEVIAETQNIRVEEVREVLRFVSLKQWGRSQWVFIDRAHRMNLQAANSLLKSIEEPPENTYFILMAPSLQSLLPTIRSRCQVVRFNPLSFKTLSALYPKLPLWSHRSVLGHPLRENGDGVPEALEKRAAWSKALVTLLRGEEAELNVPKWTVDEMRGLIAFWRELIRDIWIEKSQNGKTLVDLIHGDLISAYRKEGALELVSLRRLDQYSKRLQRADLDLDGNVDRSLIFESLTRLDAVF